ncbi:MAG: hypothetical protein LLG14_20480 [Nocardiaceae bacterium]|nr:hypothetical protein [Nocardiaceae bacterium]
MTETLVAQWRPKVRLYAQDGRLRASFITTKDAGELTLPRGVKGATGPPGLDSTVFNLVGKVANAAALPSGLSLADRGKTWAVMDVKKFGYWTGTAWKIGGSLSVMGPQGAPLRVIRGPVQTLGSDATAIQASLSTVDGGKQLSLSIPAGPKGPPGAAGPANRMIGAADLNDPLVDQGILTSDSVGWNTETAPPSAEILTAPTPASALRNGVNVVSVLSIPPRSYATRLIVTGQGTLVYSTGAYFFASNPDISIRVVQVQGGVSDWIGGGTWDYSTGTRPLTVVPGGNVLMPANVSGEVQVQLWISGWFYGPLRVPVGYLQVMRVPA